MHLTKKWRPLISFNSAEGQYFQLYKWQSWLHLQFDSGNGAVSVAKQSKAFRMNFREEKSFGGRFWEFLIT